MSLLTSFQQQKFAYYLFGSSSTAHAKKWDIGSKNKISTAS